MNSVKRTPIWGAIATMITDDFTSLQDFFKLLNESELRDHSSVQVAFVQDRQILIDLRVTDYAVFLLEESLKNGILRSWNGQFTIVPIQNH